MLVDTGATMVVISAQLADRIGLSVKSGKKWRMHTANGDTLATETWTLMPEPRPRLDLHDRRSGADRRPQRRRPFNYLGASFLRQLASVEQRNGVLILRQ